MSRDERPRKRVREENSTPQSASASFLPRPLKQATNFMNSFFQPQGVVDNRASINFPPSAQRNSSANFSSQDRSAAPYSHLFRNNSHSTPQQTAAKKPNSSQQYSANGQAQNALNRSPASKNQTAKTPVSFLRPATGVFASSQPSQRQATGVFASSQKTPSPQKFPSPLSGSNSSQMQSQASTGLNSSRQNLSSTPAATPSTAPTGNTNTNTPSVVEIDWEARNREAETRNLAVAMAASLLENQDRKITEIPLKDRELPEISAHFTSSTILKEYPPCKELMRSKGAAREKMISILEFEKQSVKWYPGPGTTGYFRESVLKSKKDAKIPKASTTRKKAESPPTTAKLAAFMNSLFTQIETAKQQVYAMPDSEVPELFRSIHEVDSSSDVEIIDEKPPEKKAKLYTIDFT